MFVVHYSSTQTHCPSVVSVEVPELTLDREALLIKSEVALGRDCGYTLHLTSRNGAGDTNSTGTLSFSQSLKPFRSSCLMVSPRYEGVDSGSGGVGGRGGGEVCVQTHPLPEVLCAAGEQ